MYISHIKRSGICMFLSALILTGCTLSGDKDNPYEVQVSSRPATEAQVSSHPANEVWTPKYEEKDTDTATASQETTTRKKIDIDEYYGRIADVYTEKKIYDTLYNQFAIYDKEPPSGYIGYGNVHVTAYIKKGYIEDELIPDFIVVNCIVNNQEREYIYEASLMKDGDELYIGNAPFKYSKEDLTEYASYDFVFSENKTINYYYNEPLFLNICEKYNSDTVRNRTILNGIKATGVRVYIFGSVRESLKYDKVWVEYIFEDGSRIWHQEGTSYDTPPASWDEWRIVYKKEYIF